MNLKELRKKGNTLNIKDMKVRELVNILEELPQDKHINELSEDFYCIRK